MARGSGRRAEGRGEITAGRGREGKGGGLRESQGSELIGDINRGDLRKQSGPVNTHTSDHEKLQGGSTCTWSGSSDGAMRRFDGRRNRRSYGFAPWARQARSPSWGRWDREASAHCDCLSQGSRREEGFEPLLVHPVPKHLDRVVRLAEERSDEAERLEEDNLLHLLVRCDLGPLEDLRHDKLTRFLPVSQSPPVPSLYSSVFPLSTSRSHPSPGLPTSNAQHLHSSSLTVFLACAGSILSSPLSNFPCTAPSQDRKGAPDSDVKRS
eukprot:764923-Hanusia_phi.AAC.10